MKSSVLFWRNFFESQAKRYAFSFSVSPSDAIDDGAYDHE